MKYEYIIDLNGKAVPQELIRKGNENIWPREIEEGKYVIIDTYAITSDYIDAAFIYDSFHERTEQEWLEKKGYCKGKVTNIGDNLIPFCKDLKMDDNPIILLYYFKK